MRICTISHARRLQVPLLQVFSVTNDELIVRGQFGHCAGRLPRVGVGRASPRYIPQPVRKSNDSNSDPTKKFGPFGLYGIDTLKTLEEIRIRPLGGINILDFAEAGFVIGFNVVITVVREWVSIFLLESHLSTILFPRS